jgi:deoxyadenosine/deoxycytidine kinase
LLRRIHERGRVEERNITVDFLDGLGAYYRTFPQVAAGKYKLDVLTVDVTGTDIRAGEDRDWFLRQAAEFLDSR